MKEGSLKYEPAATFLSRVAAGVNPDLLLGHLHQVHRDLSEKLATLHRELVKVMAANSGDNKHAELLRIQINEVQGHKDQVKADLAEAQAMMANKAQSLDSELADDGASMEAPISDTLKRSDAARAASLKRIEEQARPGETYGQAAVRLLHQNDKQPSAKQGQKPRPKPSIRKPPEGNEHPDFFVPTLYDIATKDNRSIMDVAVFRLSKKNKRASETICYTLTDGYVEVKAGLDGMASVWDYDIVLMAISHLTDAMNRYRQGHSEKPGRLFRPHVSEILKFCRRSNGGRQYEEIESALDRLKNTSLKIVRTTRGDSGRAMREAEAEGLISNYRTMSYADNGRLSSVEIEVPNWIYREVVEAKNPEVLTVHPEFFLIEPGIGRFLYRLARRAAGKGQAKWSFETIYERSGSTGTLKKFAFTLRRLIAANDLPEYTLAEEQGQSGLQLVMTYRETPPAPPLEANTPAQGKE